jgi:cell division protein FtsQ
MSTRGKRQASRNAQQEQATGRWQPVLKYGLLGVLVLAVMTGVVGGVLWIRDPHNMPLRHVEITGEFAHLDHAALAAAIEPVARGGFFTVDVAAVQAAAVQLPWAASASVRRVWPDRLEVRVEEQQAVARWQQGSLLNPRGEVFTPASLDKVRPLPQLVGPEDLRERVIHTYTEALAALQGIDRSIARIRLDARRAWHLTLDDGVQLKLGRDDVMPRLKRFVRVYPSVFAGQAQTLNTVDMRYSNGFAVRWKKTQEG